MGVIANNHIYEINEDLGKKMSNIIRGQNVQFMGDLIEDHKETEKEPKLIKYYKSVPDIDGLSTTYTIHCVNQKDLNELYVNLLKQGKVYSSKWKGESVTDIYINRGSKISASPIYEVSAKICNDFDLTFTNQGLPAIERELWRIHDMPWVQSVFSNELKKLYMNNESPMWISVFYELFDKTIPKNYKISAIDPAKQYTSICLNGDFYTHDVLDYVVVYDTSKEITYGMYYIETDINSPPFKKNGFYDYQVVRGALEHNLIRLNIILQGIIYPIMTSIE
jgi:hypothetical protein